MHYFRKPTVEQVYHFINSTANIMLIALPVAIAIAIAIALTSCSSTKDMIDSTIPVETIRETIRCDTIYLTKLEYDSIYVSQDRSQEYHLNPLNRLNPLNPDTVVIREHDVEFRYRLLHDTIYKTNLVTVRDSIPYEVTITKYRQVPYVPWYAKCLIWIGALSILALTIFLIIKLS